jgi:hypothetical protein
VFSKKYICTERGPTNKSRTRPPKCQSGPGVNRGLLNAYITESQGEHPNMRIHMEGEMVLGNGTCMGREQIPRRLCGTNSSKLAIRNERSLEPYGPLDLIWITYSVRSFLATWKIIINGYTIALLICHQIE